MKKAQEASDASNRLDRLSLYGRAIHRVAGRRTRAPRNIATVNSADLPREARQTKALIKQGALYPYKKDGVVFLCTVSISNERCTGDYFVVATKESWQDIADD
jgi:guanyl-specific ribonuclease Sa